MAPEVSVSERHEMQDNSKCVWMDSKCV